MWNSRMVMTLTIILLAIPVVGQSNIDEIYTKVYFLNYEGKTAEADALVERSIAENPKSQRLYLMRASAEIKAKKCEAAMADLNTALALAPNDEKTLVEAGGISFACDHDVPFRFINKYLEHNSESFEVVYLRLRLVTTLNRSREMAQDSVKLIELRPAEFLHFEPYVRTALTALAMSPEWDDLFFRFTSVAERLWAAAPDEKTRETYGWQTASPYLLRASKLHAKGDHEAEFADTVKTLRFVSNAEQYDTVGHTYYLHDRYSDAEKYFGSAIEKFPKSAAPYRYRAIVYMKTGKYGPAIKDWETVNQLTTSFTAEAARSIAECRSKLADAH